ncbi:MAG: hypothetical protein GY906_15225 [bacterium]|nr:hypothetical protein [bacterium]
MTTNHKNDSEVFRAVLIEEVRARGGDHPEINTLVDYLTGALDPKADGRVQDHLAACHECATKVLDLEPLVEPDAVPEGVADLELETAWRDLRSRIRASENVRRSTVARRWSTALAASLLVATAGLSVWVSQLQQATTDLRQQIVEFSKPQVNLPVFYVDELTRSSNRGLVAIEVPLEASYFVLIFSSAEVGSYEHYELVFANSEGTEVMRSGGLKESDSGGLRLGLARGALPAGDYLIRLEAQDDGVSLHLDEYRRRISYAQGP